MTREETDTEQHLPPFDDEAETLSMAPTPANAIGSIPRLRRELLGHEADLRSALQALFIYQKAAQPRDVPPDVAVVLACAASDTSYPPLDREATPRFNKALSAANEGGCKGYAFLAIKIVESALKICISGLASLDLLDALDEDVSVDLHNLHPSMSARRLIRLGHALSRGSVPGWREGDE